jgi:hypothetical protein
MWMGGRPVSAAAAGVGGKDAAAQADGILRILFGGDLGRFERPVLPDPSPVAEADILPVFADSPKARRVK